MIVYTSIDDLELKNHDVRSYKDLDDEFCEWIDETTIELLEKRNEAERMAGEYLKELYSDIDEQPFFLIANRSYFLDYYIPSRNIAVEIDGGYHKGMKKADRLRDIDFLNIGIKTVRIKAERVIEKGIKKEDLCHFSISKKKKKKHKKKPNYCALLNKTSRKVQNAPKMKYDANWWV